VDQDYVERIRGATFPVALRGYDRHEVQGFLNEVADWLETGGSDEARADLVAPELERIGTQVSNILTEANEAATTMRADAEAEVRHLLAEANRTAEEIREGAERYADETREGADAFAIKTRSEANSRAEELRVDADAYLAETREEAEAYDRGVRKEADDAAREETDKARAEARRIVEEANRRRAEIERVIGDLEQRRQAVIDELRRLATDVAGAAGASAPGIEPAAGATPSSDNGADESAAPPATPQQRSSSK
jgi:DivIVA domain-containing protein